MQIFLTLLTIIFLFIIIICMYRHFVIEEEKKNDEMVGGDSEITRPYEVLKPLLLYDSCPTDDHLFILKSESALNLDKNKTQLKHTNDINTQFRTNEFNEVFNAVMNCVIENKPIGNKITDEKELNKIKKYFCLGDGVSLSNYLYDNPRNILINKLDSNISLLEFLLASTYIMNISQEGRINKDYIFKIVINTGMSYANSVRGKFGCNIPIKTADVYVEHNKNINIFKLAYGTLVVFDATQNKIICKYNTTKFHSIEEFYNSSLKPYADWYNSKVELPRFCNLYTINSISLTNNFEHIKTSNNCTYTFYQLQVIKHDENITTFFASPGEKAKYIYALNYVMKLLENLHEKKLYYGDMDINSDFLIFNLGIGFDRFNVMTCTNCSCYDCYDITNNSDNRIIDFIDAIGIDKPFTKHQIINNSINTCMVLQFLDFISAFNCFKNMNWFTGKNECLHTFKIDGSLNDMRIDLNNVERLVDSQVPIDELPDVDIDKQALQLLTGNSDENACAVGRAASFVNMMIDILTLNKINNKDVTIKSFNDSTDFVIECDGKTMQVSKLILNKSYDDKKDVMALMMDKINNPSTNDTLISDLLKRLKDIDVKPNNAFINERLARNPISSIHRQVRSYLNKENKDKINSAEIKTKLLTSQILYNENIIKEMNVDAVENIDKVVIVMKTAQKMNAKTMDEVIENVEKLEKDATFMTFVDNEVKKLKEDRKKKKEPEVAPDEPQPNNDEELIEDAVKDCLENLGFISPDSSSKPVSQLCHSIHPCV